MHAAAGQRAFGRGSGSGAASTLARLNASPDSSVLDLSAATARMGVDEAEAALFWGTSPRTVAEAMAEASMGGEGGRDAAETPAESAAGMNLPPLPEASTAWRRQAPIDEVCQAGRFCCVGAA